VRVRIEGFERAYITIKGPAVEATRDEFEYDIPCFGEAETLLDRLCSAKIEKTRYKVTINGMMWEVDVFHGANSPLIVAEVELEYENQNIFVPPWVGLEVTEDPRYTNEHLAQFPYSTWGK
jgi:CYTH domain-containing protein